MPRLALSAWTAESPLPRTANEGKCLKVLADLHRLDGLSWERITAICRFAAREWAPKGFIASPVKLRQPTRSGEMKTWEAIERQLPGPQGTPSPSTPPEHRDRLTESSGDLITDPRTRLRRLQKYWQGATRHPDQGRWYTLPDEVVQAGEIDEATVAAILARAPVSDPASSSRAKAPENHPTTGGA